MFLEHIFQVAWHFFFGKLFSMSPLELALKHPLGAAYRSAVLRRQRGRLGRAGLDGAAADGGTGSKRRGSFGMPFRLEGGWIKGRTGLVSLRVLEIVEICSLVIWWEIWCVVIGWMRQVFPTAITYWTFQGVCHGNLSPKLHPPTSTKKRGRNFYKALVARRMKSKSLCL